MQAGGHSRPPHRRFALPRDSPSASPGLRNPWEDKVLSVPWRTATAAVDLVSQESIPAAQPDPPTPPSQRRPWADTELLEGIDGYDDGEDQDEAEVPGKVVAPAPESISSMDKEDKPPSEIDIHSQEDQRETPCPAPQPTVRYGIENEYEDLTPVLA